jgi:hypothetical protein
MTFTLELGQAVTGSTLCRSTLRGERDRLAVDEVAEAFGLGLDRLGGRPFP